MPHATWRRGRLISHPLSHSLSTPSTTLCRAATPCSPKRRRRCPARFVGRRSAQTIRCSRMWATSPPATAVRPHSAPIGVNPLAQGQRRLSPHRHGTPGPLGEGARLLRGRQPVRGRVECTLSCRAARTTTTNQLNLAEARLVRVWCWRSICSLRRARRGPKVAGTALLSLLFARHTTAGARGFAHARTAHAGTVDGERKRATTCLGYFAMRSATPWPLGREACDQDEGGAGLLGLAVGNAGSSM